MNKYTAYQAMYCNRFLARWIKWARKWM